jgi:beta-phosphoglucomutase-like phosphatase (HAD superfamily)
VKFAALILDFDGLILDTESPIFEEWRATFRARGHDLGLDVWQHALGTHGTYDPATTSRS